MFVKEGLYECHCHNVSVLRLSMKRLMLAFMSCYKMSCYHHQRFCLARCGQKGCLIGTCKKKWSSKCIFMLAIKSFCVCVLSLCVQSSQNYGCKLNYRADTFSDVMFYNCFHFHVSTKYIIILSWSSIAHVRSFHNEADISCDRSQHRSELHICKLETNYVVSYFCIAVTKTPLATVIQLNKT